MQSILLVAIHTFLALATHCSGFAQTAFVTTDDANTNNMQTSTTLTKRTWGKIEKLQSAAAAAPFDVFRLFMDDDGTFPNNPRYPLLLYKSAFAGSRADGVRAITEGDEWTSPWAWGVFTYHHYHSTAWELLLCVKGEANVQLGGERGPTVLVSSGDLVLVPPGFAHKQLDSKGGFTLLGSYPTLGWSGSIDTLTGPPTPKQRDNIATCPLPPRDPVFGLDIPKMCV